MRELQTESVVRFFRYPLKWNKFCGGKCVFPLAGFISGSFQMTDIVKVIILFCAIFAEVFMGGNSCLYNQRKKSLH